MTQTIVQKTYGLNSEFTEPAEIAKVSILNS